MGSPIICFGGAHIDTKAFAHEKVTWGSKNPVRLVSSFGGVGRNVVDNLCRLDVPCSLFSRVGTDREGDAIISAMTSLGVDTTHITRSSTRTASYTALLDPSGDLVVAFSAMDIYDEINFYRIDEFMSAKIWIVDANMPEDFLVDLARHCPRTIELWATGVSVAKNRRFAAIRNRLDVFVVNAEEYNHVKDYPRQIVVTDGKKGATLYHGSKSFAFPAFSTSVVDVTGAGDAFTAGLIFGYLRTRTTLDAMPFALAAAKMTVETSHSVSPHINCKVIDEQVERYRK